MTMTIGSLVPLMIGFIKLQSVLSSNCPDGTFKYIQSIGECFYVSKVAMTFIDAHQTCKNKGKAIPHLHDNSFNGHPFSKNKIIRRKFFFGFF